MRKIAYLSNFFQYVSTLRNFLIIHYICKKARWSSIFLAAIDVKKYPVTGVNMIEGPNKKAVKIENPIQNPISSQFSGNTHSCFFLFQ